MFGNKMFSFAEGSPKKTNNTKDAHFIFQYIKRNQKIVGLLIGVRCGLEISIGWSLCNIKKDEFDMETALAICYTRLSRRDQIPPSIIPDVERFVYRCHSYFTGTKSKGKKPIISYKNFVGVFHKSKIGGKDFWNLIPVEIKTKYSILYNSFMDELYRVPQEIERKDTFSEHFTKTTIFYCTEILSSFYDSEVSEITLRGIRRDKPSGSHIKVTLEFE